MNLANASDEEIRSLLIGLWQQYLPTSSYEFIYKLSSEQVRFLLAVLQTKDTAQQEKLWEKADEHIKDRYHAIQTIIQKAGLVHIHWQEEKSTAQDQQDLQALETMF